MILSLFWRGSHVLDLEIAWLTFLVRLLASDDWTVRKLMTNSWPCNMSQIWFQISIGHQIWFQINLPCAYEIIWTLKRCAWCPLCPCYVRQTSSGSAFRWSFPHGWQPSLESLNSDWFHLKMFGQQRKKANYNRLYRLIMTNWNTDTLDRIWSWFTIGSFFQTHRLSSKCG